MTDPCKLKALIQTAIEADAAASKASGSDDEDILIQDANEADEKLGAAVREHSDFILAAMELAEASSKFQASEGVNDKIVTHGDWLERVAAYDAAKGTVG